MDGRWDGNLDSLGRWDGYLRVAYYEIYESLVPGPLRQPVKALIESKLKKYQEKIEVPYRASELMNAGV
ncbi:hypothetical protein SUGI_1226870 [Cryptomeria japonica]|uniref:Uncharacterized protein n=1 Tax=Cryptomeria japonica TaxID=3369 RepID=A0AAD3RNV8_CRYJA|nr:hypothetical protein SUGI_1226870 [Cryptomeria japonica]